MFLTGMILLTIAVVISAISTIAAVGAGLYALNLRWQIFDMCKQSKFIDEHDSNKKISTATHDKAILTLANCMNGIIDEKRSVKIRARNNECAFKDTISGISHDIRTPLTSLYGYFQMLQASSDSMLNEKYIRIIGGRIQQLQDMTEQLFTFVKLENPSYTLECGEINLTQTLCDVMFSFYNDIGQCGLEPDVDIPSEIYMVNANSAALKRVLENIIKNALVHGESELAVSMTCKGDLGETIEISVGNRVPEGESIDVSRVFERFYKADSSRHSGSTGLGLFIAKSLTERMGGGISADLTDGIFTIKVSLKRIR